MAKLTKSLIGAMSAGIISLLIAPYANALIYNVNNGLLTGIDDLEVTPGVFYDVSFLDDTFNNVFGTGLDFFNSTDAEAAATALAGALIDNVDVNGTFYDFDTIPNLTFGCENSSDNSCTFLTPYSTPDNNGDINTVSYRNATGPGGNIFDISFPSDIVINNDNFVYADWTLATSSSVPEPQSALLIATGIIGIFGLSRRRTHLCKSAGI